MGISSFLFVSNFVEYISFTSIFVERVFPWCVLRFCRRSEVFLTLQLLSPTHSLLFSSPSPCLFAALSTLSLSLLLPSNLSLFRQNEPRHYCESHAIEMKPIEGEFAGKYGMRFPLSLLLAGFIQNLRANSQRWTSVFRFGFKTKHMGNFSIFRIFPRSFYAEM